MPQIKSDLFSMSWCNLRALFVFILSVCTFCTYLHFYFCLFKPFSMFYILARLLLFNLGQIAHTHLSISSNRSILLITQGGFYMETVYIVGAVRTAIGKYGGSLKTVPAHTLAAEVMKSSAKSVRAQRHQILHDLLFSKPVSRRRFQASQSTGSVPLPCRQ